MLNRGNGARSFIHFRLSVNRRRRRVTLFIVRFRSVPRIGLKILTARDNGGRCARIHLGVVLRAKNSHDPRCLPINRNRDAFIIIVVYYYVRVSTTRKCRRQ